MKKQELLLEYTLRIQQLENEISAAMRNYQVLNGAKQEAQFWLAHIEKITIEVEEPKGIDAIKNSLAAIKESLDEIKDPEKLESLATLNNNGNF